MTNLPMIGGVPFDSVEAREKLVAKALTEEPLLHDPALNALQGNKAPVFVDSAEEGWKEKVKLAIRAGAMIKLKPHDEAAARETVYQSFAFFTEKQAIARIACVALGLDHKHLDEVEVDVRTKVNQESSRSTQKP